MSTTSAPIIVGIDPGVTTGFATWKRAEKCFGDVTSMAIHEAMDKVRAMHTVGMLHSVVFEDSRQRTWFGNADARTAKSGAGAREGAGSVKRDCTIWQDYLTSLGIPFQAVKPARGTTKLASADFKRLTGWTHATNEHGRDAAMLIFGRY